MKTLSPLRLHELFFGAFLLLTTARLLVAGALPHALLFAGMTTAVLANAWTYPTPPTPLRARLRLALFPLLVGLVYWQLGPVMSALQFDSWDATLLAADRAFLPDTPAALLIAARTPLLTEILSGCYLLFFPALLVAFPLAIIHPGASGVRLYNGLVTAYALGFLGYTLVPAAGPHLAFPTDFPPAPADGLLTRANAALVMSGSNRVDVFPSLHTAITVLLMGLLWKPRPRLFLALLLPSAGLVLATVYLHYHYAVDLLAGFALAALGLYTARFPLNSKHPNSSTPSNQA